MYRKARRDKNENAIVTELRKLGYSVQYLDLKDGPDILVGFKDKNYLFEIKSKGGRVSKGQKNWHKEWGGNSYIVYSLSDILRIIDDN